MGRLVFVIRIGEPVCCVLREEGRFDITAAELIILYRRILLWHQ